MRYEACRLGVKRREVGANDFIADSRLLRQLIYEHNILPPDMQRYMRASMVMIGHTCAVPFSHFPNIYRYTRAPNNRIPTSPRTRAIPRRYPTTNINDGKSATAFLVDARYDRGLEQRIAECRVKLQHCQTPTSTLVLRYDDDHDTIHIESISI